VQGEMLGYTDNRSTKAASLNQIFRIKKNPKQGLWLLLIFRLNQTGELAPMRRNAGCRVS